MVPDEVDMEHEGSCQMCYVHCKGDECCERRERTVGDFFYRIPLLNLVGEREKANVLFNP